MRVLLISAIIEHINILPLPLGLNKVQGTSFRGQGRLDPSYRVRGRLITHGMTGGVGRTRFLPAVEMTKGEK